MNEINWTRQHGERGSKYPDFSRDWVMNYRCRQTEIYSFYMSMRMNFTKLHLMAIESWRCVLVNLWYRFSVHSVICICNLFSHCGIKNNAAALQSSQHGMTKGETFSIRFMMSSLSLVFLLLPVSPLSLITVVLLNVCSPNGWLLSSFLRENLHHFRGREIFSRLFPNIFLFVTWLLCNLALTWLH